MTALLFSTFAFVLSVVSLAISVINWWIAKRRPVEPRTFVLQRICAVAAGYASKIKGTNAEKLAHAIEAARLLDKEDGKRDFSDAELRVGVEAALVGFQRELTEAITGAR